MLQDANGAAAVVELRNAPRGSLVGAAARGAACSTRPPSRCTPTTRPASTRRSSSVPVAGAGRAARLGQRPGHSGRRRQDVGARQGRRRRQARARGAAADGDLGAEARRPTRRGMPAITGEVANRSDGRTAPARRLRRRAAREASVVAAGRAIVERARRRQDRAHFIRLPDRRPARSRALRGGAAHRRRAVRTLMHVHNHRPVTEPPALSSRASRAETEPCATCGALLAADQRYCLSCGERRAGTRMACRSRLAPPIATAPARRPRPTAPARIV